MARVDETVRLHELLGGEPLEVSAAISPEDGMYRYATDLYFRAGLEAVRNIRLALLAAGTETVGSVLDFACGWGRVLRTLKAFFSEAAFTVCDIQPGQVDFCAETFGTRGVYSQVEPASIEFDDSFDVIWCGSLMTHVDERRWLEFLRLFESILAPKGVLVFTTYGRTIARALRGGTNLLNLTPEQAEEVVRQYDESGFGFSPSSADADTITSRPWVCSALEEVATLESLLYIERGWLGQDVVACVNGGDTELWKGSPQHLS